MAGSWGTGGRGDWGTGGLGDWRTLVFYPLSTIHYPLSPTLDRIYNEDRLNQNLDGIAKN